MQSLFDRLDRHASPALVLSPFTAPWALDSVDAIQGALVMHPGGLYRVAQVYPRARVSVRIHDSYGSGAGGTNAAVDPITNGRRRMTRLDARTNLEPVMRFPKFAKSAVAILALALAAPLAVGCAAPTGSEGEHVGTQREALEPGAVFGGAQAAVRVVGMLKSYQKYGQAEVSTGEILAEVKAVRADLNALTASIGTVQTAIMTTNKDVLTEPMVNKMNAINALFEGYCNAAASTNPEDLPKFLDGVVKGQTGIGQLEWADLTTLDALIVGKQGLSSLLTIVGELEAKKGPAAIGDDAIGRFMAEKRLVQEQAFFVLGEAHKNNPAIDLAQQKAYHQARMAEQDIAFVAATSKYNQAMAAQTAAARTAQVTACTYYDTYFFGIEMYPNDGAFQFDDAAWSPEGTAVRAHDFEVLGKTNCNNIRNAHVAKMVSAADAVVTEKLAASQQVYKDWSKVMSTQYLVGQYDFTPARGEVKNEWHSATVVQTGEKTLKWTNAANVSWTLTMAGSPSTLSVGTDCPYFAEGYTTATVKFDAAGKVSGIVGPNGDLYAITPN